MQRIYTGDLGHWIGLCRLLGDLHEYTNKRDTISNFEPLQPRFQLGLHKFRKTRFLTIMLLPRLSLGPSLFPRHLYISPSLQSFKPFPLMSFVRSKQTINQILRGGRIPPKQKRNRKSESPDLKQNPFKKAVIQKVYIVKPKVLIFQTLFWPSIPGKILIYS